MYVVSVTYVRLELQRVQKVSTKSHMKIMISMLEEELSSHRPGLRSMGMMGSFSLDEEVTELLNVKFHCSLFLTAVYTSNRIDL